MALIDKKRQAPVRSLPTSLWWERRKPLFAFRTCEHHVIKRLWIETYEVYRSNSEMSWEILLTNMFIMSALTSSPVIS